MITRLAVVTGCYPFCASNGESFLVNELCLLSEKYEYLCISPLRPVRKVHNVEGLKRKNVIIYNEKLFSFNIARIAFAQFMRKPALSLSILHRGLVSIRSIRHLIENIVVYPKGLWLSKIIVDGGVQHLHAHWSSAQASYAFYAAEYAGVPWSYTSHRWDIYHANCLGLKSKSAKFVRFISEKGRVDAEKLGSDPLKSKVIHMGVNIDSGIRSISLNNHGNFNIWCAANLIPVKGHIYLLKAIQILKTNRYKVKLHLAGEGYLKQELEKNVVELGIADDVIFLGNLPHDKLMRAYKKGDCNLLVLPSIDLGNGEHEGIPVSLMEAISIGIPVISTKTGSIPELLPDWLGATVPGKSPQELAQAITRIMDNPEFMAEIISNQKKCIDQFDIYYTINQLISAIE
jgi:colanic acid/amylovoran biosynthesis glycosyltransferase